MPVNYPKLKFQISVKRDIDTFWVFANEADFDDGMGLEWAVFGHHPFFKRYKKGDTLKVEDKIVKNYVEKLYKREKKEIEKNLIVFEKKWQNIENKYYGLVDEFFNSEYWPKGRYICYPTIWGMYPRFLEDKTFQVPFKHRNKRFVNVVIAHEMLHFVFYEYLFKKSSRYRADKHTFFVWHVSEIFNSVVQNSPEWMKLFKCNTMDYPEHEKIIKKLQKKYYKTCDWQVDSFIDNIFQEIRDNNLT